MIQTKVGIDLNRYATKKALKAYLAARMMKLTTCEICGCDLDNVDHKTGLVQMKQLCNRCEYEGDLQAEHEDGEHAGEGFVEDCPLCVKALDHR